MRSRQNGAWPRLIQFWIFGVVGALIPIIFNVVHRWNHGEPLSLVALLGRGELLLVAIAIGSPPVGALLFSAGRGLSKGISGGLSVLSIVIAAATYADAASATSGADPRRVALVSLILFVLLTLLGSACLAFAREEEADIGA